MIPENSDKHRGSAGGRPVTHDTTEYRNRNLVERFCNRMKHSRAVSSRYNKCAVAYGGGIVLAAIIDWHKHL